MSIQNNTSKYTFFEFCRTIDTEVDELFFNHEQGLEEIKIQEALNMGSDQDLLQATMAIEQKLQDSSDRGEINDEAEGVSDADLGLLVNKSLKSEKP